MLNHREILLHNHQKIFEWVKYKNDVIPEAINTLYSSVDVREASFKIAPVDINLFPGGFNNFSLDKDITCLISLFKNKISKFAPKTIGLVVENFTRNKHYLDNVDVLKRALESLCDRVFLLTVDTESLKVVSFQDGPKVELEELDLIVLNNDLTIGCPDDLLRLKNRVVPSPEFGWYKRRKATHLRLYNELILEMIQDLNLDIDPWSLTTFIDTCEGVDFKSKIGITELSEKVHIVLKQIEDKYKQQKITEHLPHVFIKPNSGTFGMGIMVAYSADDILKINKNQRDSMHLLKQGAHNNSVIIQEGVQTFLKFHGIPCENVLYGFDMEVLGRLVRFNSRKSNEQSLNSMGMEIKLADNFDIVDRIVSNISNLAVKLEGNILNTN